MPAVPTCEFIPVDVISSEVEPIAVATPDPIAAPIPSVSPSVSPFDWADIPSLLERKHLQIVAGTSGGKTTLAEWLLSKLPDPIVVLTSKKLPHQWQGREVIGVPRDFNAIAGYLQALVDVMQSRYADMGQRWGRINVVVDEVAALKRNIPEWQNLLGQLLTESREANIRLIPLCHGMQVKTLGLEGESDLLDCMTPIRLGNFALLHSRRLVKRGDLSPDEAEWLALQPRPAMVGDCVACVPEIQTPEAAVPAGNLFPMEARLAAVARYAGKKKEAISVRQVQQAKLPQLAGLSSQEIRGLFLYFEELQMGKVDGDFLEIQRVG
jgi:hypothetical protein